MGTALSATTSQLSFNFTATSTEYLQFIGPTSVSWWDVVSQPPSPGYEAIAELTDLNGDQYSFVAGAHVIADGGVTVDSPEPSSIALKLIGIGFVAVTRKRFVQGLVQVS